MNTNLAHRIWGRGREGWGGEVPLKTVVGCPPTMSPRRYQVNHEIKPTANNIGVVKIILPPNIVAIHENTLIPVGIAITIVAALK